MIDNMTTLQQDQEQREIEHNVLAFKDWLKRESKKAGADTDAAKGLFNDVVRPLTAQLEADMDDQLKTSPTRRQTWYRLVHDQDPQVLAGLTALMMLDATVRLSFKKDLVEINDDYEAITYMNMTNAAGKLAHAIRKHIFWADWIEATTAKDRQEVEKEVKEQMTDWEKTAVYERAQEAAGIEMRDWDPKHMTDLGHALIRTAVEHSTLFEIGENPDDAEAKARMKRKYNCTDCLMMTSDGMDVIVRLMKDLAVIQKRHWPMICEPMQWVDSTSGGYIVQDEKHILLGPLDLIREQCELMDEYKPTDILDALNTAQNVPWTINEPVLREMLWHYRHGKLPHSEGAPYDFSVKPRPPKPAEVKDRPEWKEARNKVNNHNRETQSKLRATRNMLRIACESNKHDRIWFAHKLDKRGRLYPVTNGLGPQGSKCEKALLQFADGKPLGPHGGYWLAVELANCWAHKVPYKDKMVGLDKVPLQMRVDWVLDNEDLIVRSVSHTRDDDSPWKQAEDPFGFLAAAYEWAGFLVMGEDYVSHINVNGDCSNSGIQHFAAILRDPVSARKVNLISGDPHDLYQEVADKTIEYIDEALTEGDYEDKDEMLRLMFWREHMAEIGRKLCKQSGMTFSYAATEFGMSGQIRKAANKAKIGDPLDPDATKPSKKTSYVAARKVYQAVTNVVERPAKAMAFLKACCESLIDADVRPEWTTPIGFMALQNYWKQKSKEVEVRWGGGHRGLKKQYRRTADTDVLKKSKQIAAISANLIHGLDSTHLMLTINRMADNGFTMLSCIHDSIGCHACDMDELMYAVRDEFCNLYAESDVFDWVQWQLEGLHPDGRLGVDESGREQGGLDIRCVMDSELFFS
jgi:DNA-directed RNA polymerase